VRVGVKVPLHVEVSHMQVRLARHLLDQLELFVQLLPLERLQPQQLLALLLLLRRLALLLRRALALALRLLLADRVLLPWVGVEGLRWMTRARSKPVWTCTEELSESCMGRCETMVR